MLALESRALRAVCIGKERNYLAGQLKLIQTLTGGVLALEGFLNFRIGPGAVTS